MASVTVWPDPKSCTHVWKGRGSKDDRQRWYRTPDGEFPGVTTILKIAGMKTEGLKRWAADLEREAVLDAASRAFVTSKAQTPLRFVDDVRNQLGEAREHQKVLTEAADIGTELHDAAKARVMNAMGARVSEPVLVHQEAQWAFNSWQSWWADCKYNPVAVEQPLWDVVQKVAGTVDFIVECPRRGLGIVDFKTGKGTYDDYHLQVAAYVQIASNWAPIQWAEIVRVPKNLTDKEFKVTPLGLLDRWDAQKRQLYTITVTREELYAAFMGFHIAWRLLSGREK